MVRRLSILFAATLIGFSLILGGNQKTESGYQKTESSAPHVWAAIAVNDPLPAEGGTNQIVFTFAVFNDGVVAVAVNPCIGRSTFVINGALLEGKDLEWFSFNLGNGPRSVDPLPPGSGTSITRGGFGAFFQKPGIYSVVWKSDCFESPPVVFRVTPREVKKARS